MNAYLFNATLGFLVVALWEVLLRRHWLELVELVKIARWRRKQRAMIAAEMKRVAALKGVIRNVGGIAIAPDGSLLLLDGWEIDVSNGAPVNRVGDDGVLYYCGYTRAELLEIHKRRDEYVERRRGNW